MRDPLEVPYRQQFSAMDDFKYTLAALFIVALPLVAITAVVLFALSWR